MITNTTDRQVESENIERVEWSGLGRPAVLVDVFDARAALGRRSIVDLSRVGGGEGRGRAIQWRTIE